MPTNTFYNLPEEKRAKLLAAAKKEFSSVPFTEVSINKIIKDADIPRGSFYMYFKGKKDLLFCMLEDYFEQMNRRIEHIFDNGGDIFQIYNEMFEATLDYLTEDNSDIEAIQQLFTSMRTISSNKEEAEASEKEISMQEILSARKKLSERELDLYETCKDELTISSRTDFEDLISILRSITKNALAQMFQGGYGIQEARKRFQNKINIIKYGVMRTANLKEK